MEANVFKPSTLKVKKQVRDCMFCVFCTKYAASGSSSSSLSQLIVGPLRQTQLSYSQFCHGLYLCCPDSSHVSVDTVHPSPLWSSSFSSPRWYHLKCLSFDVFLFSSFHMSKPLQSRFPEPLCDVLYLQSLPGVIMVSKCMSTCPSTHRHFCHWGIMDQRSRRIPREYPGSPGEPKDPPPRQIRKRILALISTTT